MNVTKDAKQNPVNRLSDEAILELGRQARSKRLIEMTNLEMHAVLFLDLQERIAAGTVNDPLPTSSNFKGTSE